MKIFKKNLRIFTVFILPRGLARKNKVVFTIFSIIVLLFTSIYIYNALHPGTTDAAWWNDDWGYRIIANVSNPGSALSDYQISITVDTATLITAGKMQSDCDDIRITDGNGNLINHWIETGGKGCNTSTTNIWVKAPSLPTSGSFLYVYYGNPSASNVQNGNTVFEFFDDFSGSSLDQSKWMTGTIGSTSGTDWSVSGGTLAGGNNNRYIQSVNTYSGDYAAYARSYTTTDNTNGFTTVGFWASTSNGFGILDHNNSSYYRNDGAWVNFAVDGTGQWTQNTVKVVGTNATYTRTGETSGSSTTTVTNSGISAEYLRFGARYDSNALNQNFTATWDWVFVKKAVATEPTVSLGSEEKSEGPIAYWKFDEGYGTVAKNSTANGDTGTLAGTTLPTWQADNQCISGKCLFFNGSTSKVDTSKPLNVTDKFTVSHWLKTASTGGQVYTVGNAGAADGFRFGITSGKISYLLGNGGYSEGTCGNVTVNDNNWHMITGVFDANGSFTCYVDGKFVATVTFSSKTGFSTTAPTIGKPPCCNAFLGFIDDLKIYNYALSADQVKAVYNARGTGAGGSAVLGATNYENLSNGLVGYWKMDESSGAGSTLADFSGNGNNGTATLWGGGNTATDSAHVVGKFGNGFSFDGGDDYIDIGSPLGTSTKTRTYSIWVKPTAGASAGRDGILGENSGSRIDYGNGIGTTTFHALVYFTGGTITELTGTGNGTSGWSHLALSMDNENGIIKFYVNGTLSSTQTWDTSTKSINNSTTHYIGRVNSASKFPGTMDEARVYNRALDSAEVSQLYNFAPGPVAYWDFEEGQGTTLNDKSGNGNAGTWSGSGSHWTQGKYGKAGNFNGTNDGVVVSNFDYNVLQQGNEDASWTLSIWAKGPDNASTAKVLLGRRGWNAGIMTYTGGYSFQIRNDATTLYSISKTVADINSWHFLTAVYENRSMKFFVDGQLAGTTSLVGTMYNYTTNLGIGEDGGGFWQYNGKLDEAKIYNYGRTPKQIVEDMNAGHPAGGSPVGSQVAYWKFDEGYGTTAYNSGNCGSTCNGTLNNMASPPTATSGWQTNGKFGKALAFNKGSTYVDMGNPTALQITSDMTISAWIYPSLFSSNGGIASKYYNSNGNRGYNFGVISSGLLSFRASVDGTATVNTTSTNSVPLNTWSYVSVAYNAAAGTASYYINGKLDKTATGLPSSIYNPPARNFQVGAWDSGATGANLFAGLIDEVKVYNYALSADEVKIDYNRGSTQVLGSLSDTSGLTGGSVASNSASAEYCIPGDTATCSPPVARWNFEEKSGSTTNDSSGNGYSGTLTSLVKWVPGQYGSGLNFPANGQNATVTGMGGLLGSTLTVEAWINYSGINSSGFDRVVARGWVGNGWLLGVYESGGAQRAMFGIAQSSTQYNASGTLSSVGFSPGKLHLVGVYDGTTTYLYINGRLAFSNAGAPDGATLDTSSNIIFANTITNPITMDDVRIYNYARTPAQIAWDYNRGGPVGHWKMDECQGASAYDSSGNGNAGTITIGGSGTQTSVGTCTTSGAWYNGAAGKFNYSLNFDGTDDYVDAGNSSSLNVGSADFTASIWTYPTTTSKKFFLQKSDLNDGWNVGFNNSGDNQIFLELRENGSTNIQVLTYSSTIQSSNWYHVVVVKSGTDLTVYKNGKSLGTQTTYQNISNSSANFKIGYLDWWGAGYFQGQIDDARIFNYALTAAQVKNLMNQGAVRFGPVTGSP